MAQNHSAMSFPSGAPPEKYASAAAAKPLAYLGKDKLVRQLPRQACGRFTGGDLLFVFFAHVQGPVKDLALQAMARLAFGLLADFFIDPRHGNNNGRLGFLQHLRELVKDGAIHNGDAVEVADDSPRAAPLRATTEERKGKRPPAPTPPVCWP